MSKPVTISLLATATAAAMVALTSGVAAASPAASAANGAAKPRVVTIAMADPGCHWFSVAGKNVAKLTVNGKTAFRNRDEAALVFTGKNYLQHLAVGQALAIAKPGVYHITMVGQHEDDNTLQLVVN